MALAIDTRSMPNDARPAVRREAIVLLLTVLVVVAGACGIAWAVGQSAQTLAEPRPAVGAVAATR